MKWIIAMSVFLISLFGLILIPAGTGTAQQEQSATFNNLEMRIQHSPRSGWFLSSDYSYQLRKKNSNRNRSFTFYESGVLMVFIGTDDYDRMSKSTGSRTFHLMPYKEKQTPAFGMKDAVTVEAQLPGGYRAYFSTETGELTGIDGYAVATSPMLHFDEMVKKQGGVEIRPEKGFLLFDYGWRTGGSSISQLWKASSVIDGLGNKCGIKNGDVYFVDPKDKDEVIFKFNNNGDLDGFLMKKCPKLVR